MLPILTYDLNEYYALDEKTILNRTIAADPFHPSLSDHSKEVLQQASAEGTFYQHHGNALLDSLKGIQAHCSQSSLSCDVPIWPLEVSTR